MTMSSGKYIGWDELGTTTAGPAELLRRGRITNLTCAMRIRTGSGRLRVSAFIVRWKIENSAVFRTADETTGPYLPDMTIPLFVYPQGSYSPGESLDFMIALSNIGDGNAIAFNPVTEQAEPFTLVEARLSVDQIWGNAV